MEEAFAGLFIISWALFLAALIVGGGVCGIVAMTRYTGLVRRLSALELDLNRLRERLGEAKVEVPTPPVLSKPALPQAKPVLPEKEKPRLVSRLRGKRLELMLGTKWLVWAGMALTLVGVALFLKFAYDSEWIGPRGRLAIGTLAGVIALVLGERFRRKAWTVLFHTMTGGGIAAFYICIFFSFQVYHLSGQAVSMGLASVVAAFAVAMAVGHNAVAIAIVGLIGGFLSPVLLSTGENHPYALFIYIAVLDLVALGSAYFRRWRGLDLFSFLGTAAIYQGWFERFYGVPDQPSQMLPALTFASLFYLMFLLIPTLHSLARRLPESLDQVILIAANASFSFYCYYDVLFETHRHALGFVVLGQALLVFLLFDVWRSRLGKEGNMGLALLCIALALVTLVIPIELKLYAIPVAWAAEGILFTYLGILFGRILVRIAGALALLLAAAALFDRLPLHTIPFTPVLNIPFGSWAAVTAAILGAAYLLHGHEKGLGNRGLAIGASLLGFALGCLLLSLETSTFWTTRRPDDYITHELGSLVVLWSLIPLGTAAALLRRKVRDWMFLPLICYGIGIMFFLVSLTWYQLPSPWLALNYAFSPRLAFILSLWWGGALFRRGARQAGRPDSPPVWQNWLAHIGTGLTIVGHALLAVLLAVELNRWGEHSELLSDRMATSLISAAWAVQAFALVWLGLAWQNRPRRIVGFVLFGLTIAKVCFYDLSTLERIYQVVSFMASGLLALTAGYFYQRYSAILLGKGAQEPHI